jgi:Ca2+-binding EF-hand superfamily protein
MFSLTRRRREAERNKKLEDVFREADANGNGKITQEQMIKIFEVNDVAGEHSNGHTTKKRTR